MKLRNSFTLQKQLKNKLCDDFGYSIVLEADGGMLLAVSCHRSDQYKFNTNKHMQICRFTEADLELEIDVLVDSIVKMYKEIMVEKTIEENENSKMSAKAIGELMEKNNATH